MPLRDGAELRGGGLGFVLMVLSNIGERARRVSLSLSKSESIFSLSLSLSSHLSLPQLILYTYKLFALIIANIKRKSPQRTTPPPKVPNKIKTSNKISTNFID